MHCSRIQKGDPPRPTTNRPFREPQPNSQPEIRKDTDPFADLTGKTDPNQDNRSVKNPTILLDSVEDTRAQGVP
jgi:hypothetical protein